MSRLKTLIDFHRSLRFPDFPENEEFSDLVADLVELDGYYVGLLTSFEAGAKVLLSRIQLNKFESALNKFALLKDDREVYNQCIVYVKSLKDMLDEAIPIRN